MHSCVYSCLFRLRVRLYRNADLCALAYLSYTSTSHTHTHHRLNCIFIWNYWLDFLVHGAQCPRTHIELINRRRFSISGPYNVYTAVCDYDRSSPHDWALQSPSLTSSVIACAHFVVHYISIDLLLYISGTRLLKYTQNIGTRTELKLFLIRFVVVFQ